eukprot:TRINITY_DN8025_c0_g1_i1.p1 TRINITY_DN8025_c0_g1~~TRINITY_DN8025_c0_g1_i1.p1  ORF type:complete len:415 (+),score=102.63 TRINITY_DN8025_c0_g1_i1:308-1552(+)
MMEVQSDRFSQPLNQAVLTPSKPLTTALEQSPIPAKRRSVDRVFDTIDRAHLFDSEFRPRLLRLLRDSAADPSLVTPSLNLRQQVAKAIIQLAKKLLSTQDACVMAQFKRFFETLWLQLDSTVAPNSPTSTGEPSAKRASRMSSPGKQRRQVLEAALSSCMTAGAWHGSFIQAAADDQLDLMTAEVVDILLPQVIKNMAGFLLRYRVQAMLDDIASRCDKSKEVAGFAADGDTIAEQIGNHIVRTDRRTLTQYIQDRQHMELDSAEQLTNMQRRSAMLATLEAMSQPQSEATTSEDDDNDDIQVKPVMLRLFRRIEQGVEPELNVPHADGRVVINRVLLNSGVLRAWNDVVTQCLELRAANPKIGIVELPVYHSSDRTLMLATLIHRYFVLRMAHHNKVKALRKVICPTPTTDA